MSNYKTDQEAFWAGEFGNGYVDRNKSAGQLACNIAAFSKILQRTDSIRSVIEFGANIGMNLRALAPLLPGVELSAVEINSRAVEELRKLPDVKVYHESILEFAPDYQRDLALIKGVLIHINPDFLPQVYDMLYAASKRYICVHEYYNDKPVEITYHGQQGKLFKRDFAGEMLDRFSDLKLVDYGFVYNRDPNFADDDTTWFLMEKR